MKKTLGKERSVIMKKVVVGVTILMFLAVTSFVLFAKSSLSHDELDSVTAQEGVTIEFGGTSYTASHFYIWGNFGPQIQSWGDGNGFALEGYTGAGWVGFKNGTMDASSAIYLYSNMTIDVGTSGSITKAFVGLPSVLAHPVAIQQTLTLGNSMNFSDAQPALGTSYLSEFAVLVNPTMTGYISISNHGATGTQGVEIGFGGLHPFMNPMLGGYPAGVILSIPGQPIIQSWGDADGFAQGGYTGAGYVGAKGLSLAAGYPAAWPTGYLNILVSGTMSIDVGTSGSETSLIIGVPTINLLPGTAITQPLALGNVKDFSDNQALLGTAYISGISVSPAGSLAIHAH